MQVMLDTNILISAFIFKSKTMNTLIKKLSEEHEIIMLSYCIEELKELINIKFNIDTKKLENFLKSFPYKLVIPKMDNNEKIFNIRDENDYIILHTAIIEDVDILITGDKDFKAVEIERPEILTAREFLDRY